MTLVEIKLFLRIDHVEEDELLHGLQLSAERYLDNAGVVKDYTNELYKLAIKLLISYWYENREAEKFGKTSTKLKFSLDSMITQLKYCGGAI